MKPITKTEGSCSYFSFCNWHIPFPETPETEEEWKRAAVWHRQNYHWINTRGKNEI